MENLVEHLPFPDMGNPPEPYMLRWLANVSSRRLLNRIHYIHYDRSTSEGDKVPRRLFKVTEELDHQLHAWFDLLPMEIKPDLADSCPSPENAVLIMRFHAAGDIIYRPFLHQALGVPPHEDADPRVVFNAEKCLIHCRNFLDAVSHVVDRPRASMEIFLHS